MTENEKIIPVPEDLLDCIAHFIHQIEINDYVTKDGLHELKMNAYWPAVHGFYVSMIQNGFSFTNPDLNAHIRELNKARLYLLDEGLK